MTEEFRPTLLLSMPQLQDPNFARTVVLLCDFVPDGAFGLVLNRPTDMPASDMVRLEPPVMGGNALPLCIGGPVEPERGWILLAGETRRRRPSDDPGRYLSLHLAHAAAAGPHDEADTTGACARRVRGLGARSARRRARTIRVAHGRRRSGPRVRRRPCSDVGNRHPAAWRGSVSAPDEPGGALSESDNRTSDIGNRTSEIAIADCGTPMSDLRSPISDLTISDFRFRFRFRFASYFRISAKKSMARGSFD